MKTIIAGSRQLSDYAVLEKAIADSGVTITEVVSGGATGIDRLGETWANNNQIPVKQFPAFWKQHGKAAGPLRNQQMAEYGEALIAIWDGKSRGTMSMIGLARKHGLKIYVKEV